MRSVALWLTAIPLILSAGCASLDTVTKLRLENDNLKRQLEQQQSYVASSEDRDSEIQTNCCLQALIRMGEDVEGIKNHDDALDEWNEDDKGQIVWRP